MAFGKQRLPLLYRIHHKKTKLNNLNELAALDRVKEVVLTSPPPWSCIRTVSEFACETIKQKTAAWLSI
jgi:hypothetical protein